MGRWKAEPLESRFWAKVQRTRGCWRWLGAKHPTGYGVIGAGRRGDGLVLAHRLSWMIHRGEIPEGMCVCHHCDNPPCTNPKHLFLGTKADNAQDMVSKGRRPDVSKRGKAHHFGGVTMKSNGIFPGGEAHPRSILTWPKVRAIRRSALSQRKLAAMYGVHPATIFAIIHRKSWRTSSRS